MRFQVLGRLSVEDGGQAVDLPPSRPATLLAALLLHHDEVVPIHVLQRAVWGQYVPTTAKSTIQTYISRLRRLFVKYGWSKDLIVTMHGGYRIMVGPAGLDLARFRELADAAEAAEDPQIERSLLVESLRLWRGAPLTNVDSPGLHRFEVADLEGKWLRVAERRFDLELCQELGRHALADLRSAVARRPDHERFREQLAEALIQSGRRAEALAEVRQARGYFHNDLGVSTGPVLRRIEESLNPRSHGPRAGSPSDGLRSNNEDSSWHQLPADLPQLVGRDAETASLTQRLTTSQSGPTVLVLTGPPGVGKSALAIHLAHLVKDAYPGGCSWMPPKPAGGLEHQRGCEASPGVEPSTAALGSAAGALECLPDEGRRLVILDDIQSCEQAEGLLPHIPGSAAIVTSRRSLADLAISRGACCFRIGTVTGAASEELLSDLIGPDRMAAEPRAAKELAALCGGFPIALRAAALWLALRPHCRIEEYVASVRADPLAMLSLVDSAGNSLAALLRQATSELDRHTLRTFAAVGRIGTDEVTAEQCAALLRVDPTRTAPLLEALVERSLLEEGPPRRFHMHRAFQAFACSLAIAS
ncbi:BTAD domain-containing putative transcriptional regulator [Streptomyces sp. NPDC127084]|uniref:BTAD domain-containing putative transcriptional regulator n=1 Tax=Streptomyces sp. NPDC127084 TaxID=3347133 RepID=UPI00364C4E16